MLSESMQLLSLDSDDLAFPNLSLHEPLANRF
jgi:hypothetical protein